MTARRAAIAGADLAGRLRARGYDFFSGVPCSLLGGLWAPLEAQREAPFVSAVREDTAVGHAAGAFLAGRKPLVLMQNSGLGTALNAIVSLSQLYALPVLLVVSWRGEGGHDAPEHLVMGAATTGLLDAVALPYRVLDPADVEAQLDAIDADLTAGRPTAWLVPEGTIA